MPRLRLLLYVFVGSLLLVILRLTQIQVFEHWKYQVLARNQHFTSYTTPAPRGQIFSSDGFLLVGNEARFLLYAEPKLLKENPKDLADKLVVIIYPKLFEPAPYRRDIRMIMNHGQDFEAALSREDLYWVALAHGLDGETKKQIEDLNIVGLGFREESERFYPEGDLAEEVLGFVGQNKNGQPQGYFGVEGYYNGDLSGRDGEVLQEKNALGQPIILGNYLETPALSGKDLVLTINRTVQFLLERKLKSAIDAYGAVSATGVILDPENGDILAMSSKFAETTSSAFPRNLAIDSAYEPGSVIKALTMAAAIDSGVAKPTDTYNDVGPVLYSGHYVDTWDKKHHGLITLTRILELSNNCGAAWVGEKLGISGLREYLLKFGLGNFLGIDLEGEASGLVRDATNWRDIDTATASFGQGISATPLQVVSVFATIANGGVLVKPHIVKNTGEVSIIRQVISSETADIVSGMLVSAVDNGESKFFNLKNYTIAGKTGTAQIAVGGSYDPTKSNATFVGFFADDPKFVMLIRFERPSSSIYAAETAVPVWMSLASELALVMGSPPRL